MQLWILAVATAARYQLAVQHGHEVLKIGETVLTDSGIDSQPITVFEAGETPACLGLISDDGQFECHTLFEGKCNQIAAREVPSGIRFEPRGGDHASERIVRIPASKAVPRPLLSVPVKETGEQTQMEPEKGFFQKYWYIIVPVGLILLTAPSPG